MGIDKKLWAKIGDVLEALAEWAYHIDVEYGVELMTPCVELVPTEGIVVAVIKIDDHMVWNSLDNGSILSVEGCKEFYRELVEITSNVLQQDKLASNAARVAEVLEGTGCPIPSSPEND